MQVKDLSVKTQQRLIKLAFAKMKKDGIFANKGNLIKTAQEIYDDSPDAFSIRQDD